MRRGENLASLAKENDIIKGQNSFVKALLNFESI
jgi:hypothetical protein